MVISEAVSWIMQETLDLVSEVRAEELEATAAVLYRAKALLPKGACNHGIVHHDHAAGVTA